MKYSGLRAVIAIFLLCHLPALVRAQPTQRNLLGTRYSQDVLRECLVSYQDWKPFPNSPADWAAAVSATQLDAVVKAGEESLKFKFEPISATLSLDFVRSGDRTRHSKVSFAKRDALLRLVVAESIEGKGRFMEAIMNGLWSICEESYWGVPAHIGATGLPDVENPVLDLFSAETATLLALTDYFVGEKLDQVNPLFRKRMYGETKRRIFTPLLTGSSGYGWLSKTKPVNNWNPWIHSNVIASTLFLEKDPAMRLRLIYTCMTGLDLYLNSLGDAAGCDEGPGYWSAAGASTFDCLELLFKATQGKVTLFAEPLVRNMAAYIYKAHIAGPYFINFADAGPKASPDGIMVYRFGEAIQDPQMCQFGLWLMQGSQKDLLVEGNMKVRRLENLLNYSRLPKEKSTYQPLREAWISDVQVLTARTDKGLFLGSHGGHNGESHNHNDVGDFVIYADGQPIIVDAGSGTYTAKTFSSKRYELWYTQSNYHNLPIVNGYGQKAGREYGARAVSCELLPESASLLMDIAAAYPKEAGLKTWVRRVTLDRGKNCVELSDDYVLSGEAKSIQQSFVSVAAVDISVPGRVLFTGQANARVVLSYDPTVWSVSVDKPSHEGPDYGGFEHKWDGHPLQRLLLTQQKPASAAKLRYRFEKQD